jgi:hypothetical protein
MPGGRPRKPSALRVLEGNRSRTDIPKEAELHGLPECPDYLDAAAAEHFTFLAGEFGGAGVLKRADGPALAMLANLWSQYWAAEDIDTQLKIKARWDAAASRLGIQVIDRSKLLMGGGKQQADQTEQRFFGVTG